jgi:uncharacterized protein YkwD
VEIPIFRRRAVKNGAAAAVVALVITGTALIVDRHSPPAGRANEASQLAVQQSYQATSARLASSEPPSSASTGNSPTTAPQAVTSSPTTTAGASTPAPTAQQSTFPDPPAPAAHPNHATPPPSTSIAATSAPGASESEQAIQAVFSLLNSERAANGLPALHLNADLTASAHGHNLTMSAANNLSHQLPGEPDFGTRITNAGYHWSAAAENIGVTTMDTTAGATAIETSMYNEQPPDDGHRQNILGPYVDVGIDVIIDS